MKSILRMDQSLRTQGVSVLGESTYAQPQAKRCSRAWKKRDIPVPCAGCGYIAYFSPASLAVVAHSKGRNCAEITNTADLGWKCKECKVKDQQDVNKAILAVAARKKAKK